MNIALSYPDMRRCGAIVAVVLNVSLVPPSALSAQAEVLNPTRLVTGPVAIAPPSEGAVTLGPDNDINAVVRRRPAGTRYILRPGVYRMQQIFPKNRDSFTGMPGAVLNGARRLDRFESSGGLHVARHYPPHPDTERVGLCRSDYPRCDRPLALFFDGAPFRAVSRLADLGSGTWYFDERFHDVYLRDLPEGHDVELTYTPFAFGGNASNVTISNLVIEKYASANQQGAINNHGAGDGWTVANNEVRWNYGYGIVVGTGNHVTGNNIHHNGQLGLGGGSGTHDGFVQNNVIAFNAWNGVNCDWECGGAKWANVVRLTAVGNFVHDNGGTGLWTDERSSAILFEANLIENNARAGISHEISHAAIIRRNVLRGNGTQSHPWGWNAQIQIQNSTDTEVYGNEIIVDPVYGGNGITVVQQDRGAEFMPRNIFVHHNNVTMAAGEGVAAGWFADAAAALFASGNNRFDYNCYRVVSSVAGTAWSANLAIDFPAWQARGFDTSGRWSSTLGQACN